MKNIIGVIALLLFVSLSQVSAQADIDRDFKLASGKLVELELDAGGSIEITGWDKEQVKVQVYFRGRDDEDCKVDFEESEKGLRVSSYYNGRRWRNQNTSMRFVLSVPKKTNLDLDSKGGAITIDGVEGKMYGKTMGGALELTNLKGDLRLHTMGGNITLTKSDVDGEVKTNGGKVTLEDVTGSVKGHSMGGAVSYKNVVDRSGKSTGDEVNISTMGGDINVDDAPSGADVQTMGGDVAIRAAKKHVRAKTMGGDIRIRSIDGSVKAVTMAGDVEVTMTGDPSQGERDVDISSKSGDITLTVPDGLSMDLDIALAYTRGKSGRYKIVSDFPLKEEASDEWDSEHGTPRKFLYGTGAVNGGKHKVRIETINGNIYLKKGS